MASDDLSVDLLEKVESDPRKAIEALYVRAEKHARGTIDWYIAAKRSKARAGGLRYVAIALTTLGGLVPVVQSMGFEHVKSFPGFSQLGYLCFALAGALIAFDRFSGLSSGWIRYITSALTLQRMLRDFQLTWAQEMLSLGGKTPEAEQIPRLVGLLRQFGAQVDAEVERETQTWAAEFQSSLADLEKMARAQVEAGRSGSIEVRTTNLADATDGVTITVDGRLMQERVRVSPFLCANIPPGSHLVAIVGTVGGVERRAAATAMVTAGQMASVTLTLPV
jgi:hypothetical protein